MYMGQAKKQQVTAAPFDKNLGFAPMLSELEAVEKKEEGKKEEKKAESKEAMPSIKEDAEEGYTTEAAPKKKVYKDLMNEEFEDIVTDNNV